MDATTISSFFTNCIKSNSKHTTPDSVFRIACLRTLQLPSIVHSDSLDSISISHKWRSTRILAAVVQEELEGATETEEVSGEKEAVEVVTAGEAEAQVEAPSGTKLYFGNLPYNCDSAQLAGIIQDYGTPELVEEFHP